MLESMVHMILYHEGGIVYDKNPYFLIILTQKGKNKKSTKFMNQAAKKINKIHQQLELKEVEKCQK